MSGPLSLDDFVRFPHILTYLTGVGPGVVDEALAKVGRTRRLAATTPRFATVPFHVQAAPLIATMADELATTFATQLGLATSPVPVPTGRSSSPCCGTPPMTAIPPIAGCGRSWFAWDGRPVAPAKTRCNS